MPDMYHEKHMISSFKDIVNEISDLNNIYKIFTKNELKSSNENRINRSLAAKFLLKKCIIEDLSNNIDMLNIEVLNKDHGEPYIEFNGNAVSEIHKLGIDRSLCSISHSRNWISVMLVSIYRKNN